LLPFYLCGLFYIPSGCIFNRATFSAVPLILRSRPPRVPLLAYGPCCTFQNCRPRLFSIHQLSDTLQEYVCKQADEYLPLRGPPSRFRICLASRRSKSISSCYCHTRKDIYPLRPIIISFIIIIIWLHPFLVHGRCGRR
jgi:hypothetical protein